MVRSIGILPLTRKVDRNGDSIGRCGGTKMPPAGAREGTSARRRCEATWWSAFMVKRGQARRPCLLPHLANETISDPGVHLSATLARIPQRLGMALQICGYASRHTETGGVAAGPALVGGASGAKPLRQTGLLRGEPVWRRAAQRRAKPMAHSAAGRFVFPPCARRVAWRSGWLCFRRPCGVEVSCWS
jgi:hypothetical protein